MLFGHSELDRVEGAGWKPDRIRKEAIGILKQMEEETGLILDPNTERKIVHIVLSHHGRWGRVTPSTKEALMVHKADEYSQTLTAACR